MTLKQRPGANDPEMLEPVDATDASPNLRLLMLWASMPETERPVALNYLRELSNEPA